VRACTNKQVRYARVLAYLEVPARVVLAILPTRSLRMGWRVFCDVCCCLHCWCHHPHWVTHCCCPLSCSTHPHFPHLPHHHHHHQTWELPQGHAPNVPPPGPQSAWLWLLLVSLAGKLLVEVPCWPHRYCPKPGSSTNSMPHAPSPLWCLPNPRHWGPNNGILRGEARPSVLAALRAYHPLLGGFDNGRGKRSQRASNSNSLLRCCIKLEIRR